MEFIPRFSASPNIFYRSQKTKKNYGRHPICTFFFAADDDDDDPQRNRGPPRITAQGASTEAETESAPEGKPDDSYFRLINTAFRN